MTAFLLSAALLVPAPHHHHCHSHRPNGCEIRSARIACEAGKTTACIRRAALHRRVSESWLRSVAWCESRFNPFATNGQYAGLFQFGPVLWNSMRYRRYSRFSAKWSSLAAAYAFSRGWSGQWACA